MELIREDATRPRRVLVAFATAAWRRWLVPLLEDPAYDLDSILLQESPDNLLTAVEKRPYDAVVFLSRHHTLLRDAVLADRLALTGVTIVAQPESVARLARDKRAMALRAEGVEGILPIPEVTPAIGQRLLAAGGLRAIVAKPPDGTEGRDMRVFRDPAELGSAGARLHEDGFLLQPFISGEEYSVTMVWYGGRCSVYAPVQKGRTNEEGVHPSRRQRTCPSPLMTEPVWRGLVQACVAYTRPLKPCGLVEMEFIRSGNEFFLLEVNPRLAATARLAAVVSKHSPLTDLIKAACGANVLGRVVATGRHAMEWLMPHGVAPDVREELSALPDVWVSTRITVAAPDPQRLAQRVTGVRGLTEAPPEAHA